MKKIKIIIVTIFSLLLVPISVYAKTNQQVMQEENQTNAAKISERNGILLDVARCPLTKYEIEQDIVQMNPQRFSYLILHLNDDEHVTFQSKILGNVGAPNTLSAEDLRVITADARKHHIILIPDFDTPGHCKALLSLLSKHSPKLARKVKMDDETLDYTNKQTIKLVEQINNELNKACSKQKYPYMMLGGDEVAGNGTHNEALMTYFNKLNAYENQKGFRSIIWNDSIMKRNNLSDKITVAYWAQGGANTASSELRLLFKERATVKNLIHHPLINANVTYNYLNLSDLNNEKFVQNFITRFNQNDYQNFNMIDRQTWLNNPDSHQNEVPTTGQLICFWGDNPKTDVQRLIQVVKELNSTENNNPN